MNVALWIVQIVLAMMMLMAGAMKVMKSKDELHEQMGWVEDFSENTLKAIGGLEVLGAIGLILPAAVTGIAPVLVPLAAVGLGITMVSATVVHVRRSEMPNVAITVMLLAMAVFVAWGRFGDYAF
jgi:uncharacterized membrane protein YphA (DoxX/SURF4 family)